MRIGVAGGTGLVGRHVVEQAAAAGHEAVVLSRSSGVDLVTGTGLLDALQGVGAIVDATNPETRDGASAAAFFTAVADNLQRAAARAGAAHVVTLSIVGVDRFRDGYYAAKREHERAALAGTVPASILRATQFHEFPAQILVRNRREGVAHIPDRRVRTVAARTVAQALVGLAEAGPRDGVGELAGPEEADLPALARAFAARRGLRVEVIAEEVAGMRAALLPGPGARIAGPRFEDWLASADALALPV